jgi:hypothetical protein
MVSEPKEDPGFTAARVGFIVLASGGAEATPDRGENH